jgi:glycosyltransferase involved in cell wall biosynthesis
VKKIFFISENTTWGGSEELWAKTALELLNKKHEVFFYVHELISPLKQISEIKIKGGKRLFSDPKIIKKIKRKINYYLKGSDSIINYDILLKINPDLVVISLGNPYSCLIWMHECIKRKTPYVLVFHLVPDFIYPNDELAEELIKCYHSAKTCFFVSNNNLKLIEKIIGFQIKNTKIIRNPFNVDFNSKIEFPRVNLTYKAAIVGRIDSYHKGLDIIMEVLKNDKWKNRNLEVNVYGEGPNLNSLIRLKEKWGIYNLNFKGFSGDISSIWSENHILILPSRMEGLPLVLVEAALCKRAAIATNVGDSAEMIDDNKSGFIAKYPYPEFLDEALERAWEKREEWESIGKNAEKKVKEIIPYDPINVFIRELNIE